MTLSFKKYVSLIVIGVFALQSSVFALSDIQNYPYKPAIEYLQNQGIIDGYPDGTFQPNKEINRAEIMKILVESVAEKSEFENLKNCFPDVNQEWFAPYVCYGVKQGWVNGYPDGFFRPANTANKAEAIKMLVNSQQWSLGEGANVFDDVKKSDWFSPYIKVAKEKGVLVETSGNFYPANLMTRGLISENIFRALTVNTNAVSDFPLTVWANEGGDKVTKDELRAFNNSNSVKNSVWNGEKVQIFGAKNEVVNFNLILESAGATTNNIQVNFNQLTGTNGEKIQTTGNDLFNWTNRDIELFYVKYLEIKGLSTFMASPYDERHLPEDLQAPHDQNGIATGGWLSRPNHNKLYPEIAVPLELEQKFSIPAGENQAIWSDIYIPKTTTAGLYKGNLTVAINSQNTKQIPVELNVLNFTLPETPTSKTMLAIGDGDINARFIGENYPVASNLLTQSKNVIDKYFQVAHRHKISLVNNGDDYSEDKPNQDWQARLNGDLFTAQNGYKGPGAGVGNNIYAIGLYGSWSWKNQGKEAMQQHANNWENWFQNNFPNVEHFLYLIDESSDYAQIEQWAKWIEESDGAGKNLPSMATTWLLDAIEHMPSLDVVASSMYVGDTQSVQSASNYFQSKTDKKLYFYNGGRPAQGSFMTDDDGVALRELAWGQFKKKIDRWFYWNATYYNNYQAGQGDTNVFKQAQTFGSNESNYSNGDGVLFYPGTDKKFPNESYNINGPISSLRLKYWRRGIQDSDYLALAMSIDPSATNAIINKIVPKVMWEYGVDDPKDPTWVRTEISWSNNPDVWEQARQDLANIILK